MHGRVDCRWAGWPTRSQERAPLPDDRRWHPRREACPSNVARPITRTGFQDIGGDVEAKCPHGDQKASRGRPGSMSNARVDQGADRRAIVAGTASLRFRNYIQNMVLHGHPQVARPRLARSSQRSGRLWLPLCTSNGRRLGAALPGPHAGALLREKAGQCPGSALPALTTLHHHFPLSGLRHSSVVRSSGCPLGRRV